MGFEEAFGSDIKTIFASELDEPARKTYRANFIDSFQIAGDITQIDASDVPDFDICLAGFPCQAFSLAGKRKGFADDYKGRARGTLFFDTLRICTERANRPSVIFCENVKGLPIHDKGRTFETILGALKEEGYVPFYKILNSKDLVSPKTESEFILLLFETTSRQIALLFHLDLSTKPPSATFSKTPPLAQNTIYLMFTWKHSGSTERDMRHLDTGLAMKFAS